MSTRPQDTLTLPSGTVLKNRLAKSAMSEALGTVDNRPTEALNTLYGRWARGGCGLLITGNVMVDRQALGEPNNVAVEDYRDMASLKAWAKAARQNGTEAWVQLNHPGKQSPNVLSSQPVAPSAIPFDAPHNRFFNTPRALESAEIEALIERFAKSAAIMRAAGFTGVQIHGAHGYLVSQFLSPHHNQRTDQWGGSLDNRMRFVTEVYQAIRREVGSSFNVGIKMNSADFQRGGFTQEESMIVAEVMSDLGMDLVEISGGTYASPEMTGVNKKAPQKASTRAREAYFMDYAEKVRERVKAPLMITGGFRSTEGLESALASGAMDLAGLARPLALDADFAMKVLNGESVVSDVAPIKTGIKMVDKMALMETAWYTRQLARLGNGKQPMPNEGGFSSLMKVMATMSYRGFRTRVNRVAGG
ncbi:NADH oxidase, putative [gamma proteobacterium HTCC5015]|nr:NADH oxidase, putative [gamma proteobacterium HTCC5015]